MNARLRSARNRLDLDGSAIVLTLDHVGVDRCEPVDLHQLIDVELPSDDPDLARFYLIEWPRARWIVPYFTPGCAPAIRALCERRSPESELYRATLDVLPWRWRARWLGVPLFPLPRLMRSDRTPLPRWTSLKGPLAALPDVAAG